MQTVAFLYNDNSTVNFYQHCHTLLIKYLQTVNILKIKLTPHLLRRPQVTILYPFTQISGPLGVSLKALSVVESVLQFCAD